ncbi:metallo hydrolase [Carpediemonas membranifera]|uniref:Metallo hydrolase n=1 Tax=Carpediemonas membranifera TaxID=201153 RepID=A0A8J6BC88_9EUKA|nr:metallo hydrolase [Carpediemonas membranifera]|eukprot:KAG9394377.1 metallo hydrolase [Carpediemonas membranifera]
MSEQGSPFQPPSQFQTTKKHRTFVNPWDRMVKWFVISRAPTFFKTRVDKAIHFAPGSPLPTTPFTLQKKKDFLAAPVSSLWIGHATVYFQIKGRLMITDPVIGRVGGKFGIKRSAPPPIKSWSDLPGVDTVLISHDHMDHLNKASVKELNEHFEPTFVCGEGVDKLLHKWGVPVDRIRTCRWWDRVDVRGTSVTFLPAQHWSQRGIHDRNTRLWGGFLVECEGKKVFYTGDTGYNSDLFKTIGTLGPMDMSLLPIGCGQPEELMRYQHVNPAAALKIHEDVQSRCTVAVHHGTYPSGMAAETLKSPGEEMAELARQQGKADCVRVGNVGLMTTID